jgi:hypothetical protein
MRAGFIAFVFAHMISACSDGPAHVTECTAGDVVACYGGPSGTQDIGACRAGTKTCGSDGYFGACTGEVVPATEDCTTAVDDDCDGVPHESDVGCVCAPNAQRSCYSGPTGTAGVGICTAGLQTCDASGTAWGSCTGEVLPDTETCTSSLDDDCDGQANESGADCVCVPATQRTCYSGPAGTAGIGACMAGMQACDASGTSFGTCMGEVIPATENCGTVTDEDCNGFGGCGWSLRAGTTGTSVGRIVKADAAGNVYVAGTFVGSIDLGGGTMTTVGGRDAFLAAYTTTGTFAWAKQFGTTEHDDIGGLDVDASGNIVLGLIAAAALDMGGGVLPAPSPNADIVLARYTMTGQHVWSKRFGDTSGQAPFAVAWDGGGNVLLTGFFTGSVDFGGGSLTAPAAADNIFVAKLTGNGSHVWSKRFGSATSGGAGLSIAADANGNVITAGFFQGTVDFGGGPLTSAGDSDVYVLKFSPAGSHVWSKRFGDAATQHYIVARPTSSGDILLAVEGQGTIDFGTGPLTAAFIDIFVARLDATGNAVWAKRFGDASSQTVRDLAVGAPGILAITGEINGSVDFGGGTLMSAGATDVYVARLSTATGAYQAANLYGDAASQSANAIAIDVFGAILVTGSFAGTIDFVGAPMTAVSTNDLFLAKLEP